MAKLDLLPRKEFIITLDDGTEVRGRFGYWAYSRFCTKNKLPLKQLQERLKEDNIMFGDAPEIILCAIEHYQVENGRPFIYSMVDVFRWIEYDFGGFQGELYSQLWGHCESEEDEKKNQNGQQTSLGDNSKQHVTGLV